MVLDGALARGPEAAALAAWTTRRLDEIMSAGSPDDPAPVFAALSLCRSGVVEPKAELLAWLDALAERGAGDVWLWRWPTTSSPRIDSARSRSRRSCPGPR